MSDATPDPLPPPLVAPSVRLPEITVRGLLLGAFLSVLLAAANAYIGLLVGLTVSASIPAAAVSMGVLRLFPRSNILENNLVQTCASAGEALVAGVIFTLPALVIMGVWQGYPYAPLVTVALLGGVQGVAFTVPLRRALIVESRLKFPEGVATAEVLKTGGVEHDGHKDPHSQSAAASGFRRLARAGTLGALFKLGETGFGWLAGSVGGTRALAGGRVLLMGDVSLSPALIGVGHIVGLNISVLVFVGGSLGTLIGVPLNWFLNSEHVTASLGIAPETPWSEFDATQWGRLAAQSWQDCRRVGVGAMIVGGVWSLVSLAKPLWAGLSASLAAYRASKAHGGAGVPRTERDTPINYVAWVTALGLVPVFSVFYFALQDYEHKLLVAAIMTLLMLVFGFLFGSVAGYMAGLVGSSNNPISGVTIATVIVSALILLQLMGDKGPAATLGPVAVIYLAGLICSAAAIAGDNMQDLKCGHLLGATPWRQQIYQVVGVVAAAFAIPWVLRVLDAGYGIGRVVHEGVAPLAAPQAALMGSLASGIFGAGIRWRFIFIGFALAAILILLDRLQEKRRSNFRVPVLAVAVGVYLPLGLSVPILVGGLIAHFTARRSARAPQDVRKARESAGMLVASGLITGEALMGVGVSVVAVVLTSLGAGLPSPASYASVLGPLAMLAVALYQYRATMGADR